MIPSDPEDRSSSLRKPRRRDPFILAVVGFAAALLLFASAALPVLTDRAHDDASGMTLMPTTTVAMSPPSTAAPPSTVPPTPPVSTAETASPAIVSEPTAVTTSPRTQGDGARARPLAVGPIDTSAYPRVAFDVLVPERLAAVQLQSNMVDVDGSPAQSVTAVDPRDIGTALVIDDGPTVDARVLGHLQGASVELVRHLGHGTEIALASPSGLASAFTNSQTANIGRIAAITAGSPAVTPLPALLTSSIRELASNPTPDRHAVLLLGAPLELTAEQLGALEQALTESGTRLHLITPTGVDAPAIASLAEASGGVVASSANVVASIDEVIAAVGRRYRVVAAMSASGEHSIALTAKGLRYEATVSSG